MGNRGVEIYRKRSSGGVFVVSYRNQTKRGYLVTSFVHKGVPFGQGFYEKDLLVYYIFLPRRHIRNPLIWSCRKGGPSVMSGGEDTMFS